MGKITTNDGPSSNGHYWVITGEDGPELLALPADATVLPKPKASSKPKPKPEG
jgi:hypothetical protein